MKRALLLFALGFLISGCAWVKGSGDGGYYQTGGTDAGSAVRGTTGVSTGADAAAEPAITGSDFAPPPR